MNRAQAFPSAYFSKEEVIRGPVRLTISDVRIETMPGDAAEEKPLMYFQERGVKPLILNSCNWQTCEDAYGNDSNDWGGKAIEVYHDPNVMFGREKKGGVRIRIPVGASVRQPAPTAPAAPAATDLLTWKDAIDLGEMAGLNKGDLVTFLKSNGRDAFNAARDTALIRDFIAQQGKPQGANWPKPGDEEVPF
jgi:hypothetical protein